MTQSLTLDFLIRGICMMRGDLFLNSHCSPPLKSMAHCFWPMNYLYSNHMSHGKRVWLSGGRWTAGRRECIFSLRPLIKVQFSLSVDKWSRNSKRTFNQASLHIQDILFPFSKGTQSPAPTGNITCCGWTNNKNSGPNSPKGVCHRYER